MLHYITPIVPSPRITWLVVVMWLWSVHACKLRGQSPHLPPHFTRWHFTPALGMLNILWNRHYCPLVSGHPAVKLAAQCSIRHAHTLTSGNKRQCFQIVVTNRMQYYNNLVLKISVTKLLSLLILY